MSDPQPLGADPERAHLDAEILRWIGEEPWHEDETRFNGLALRLFAFQFEHCEPYRRFCLSRGVQPKILRHWADIPALPNHAFKVLALRSFDAERTIHRFETSGTTTVQRGTLYLDTLALYEASLTANFRLHLLPDLERLGGRIHLRILAPSPEEVPTSSLSHMFGFVLERFGDSASAFDLHNGELRVQDLTNALLTATQSNQPVALCGTSFAFVHLLEHFQREALRLALPSGSRLMETGGYKGRAREWARPELLRTIEAALGIPPQRVINQYGMTELGSQFYDSNLRFPEAPIRKLCPPWTRVRILDPNTMQEAKPGEPGLIAIYDLTNTGSVLALQTADLGRTRIDGFEVLGRVLGAPQRGCSIGADLLLSGEDYE